MQLCLGYACNPCVVIYTEWMLAVAPHLALRFNIGCTAYSPVNP